MAKLANKKDYSFLGMTVLWLIVIILVPVIIDLFGKLFIIFGPEMQTFAKENLWLEGVLGYLPIYLLILFYIKATFNPFKDFGYVWNNKYTLWAVYLGLGSGLVMFGIDKFVGQTTVQAFSTSAAIGYLFGWVLLPALTEETLFRGVIQTYYQSKFKKTFSVMRISVAVVIASIFELLFHLSVPVYFGISGTGVLNAFFATLPQLVYVAIFGFIGGIMYQRTKSLACPVIIHALGNATELALLWLIR